MLEDANTCSKGSGFSFQHLYNFNNNERARKKGKVRNPVSSPHLKLWFFSTRHANTTPSPYLCSTRGSIDSALQRQKSLFSATNLRNLQGTSKEPPQPPKTNPSQDQVLPQHEGGNDRPMHTGHWYFQRDLLVLTSSPLSSPSRSPELITVTIDFVGMKELQRSLAFWKE